MTNTYLYLLRPVKRGILYHANPEREAAMDQHFKRFQQALSDGELLLARPCEDNAFEIVIFRPQSSDDAQRFVSDDPAVRKGLMSAEMQPFRVSLITESTWHTKGTR